MISDLVVWLHLFGEHGLSLDGLMIILIISGGIQLSAPWLVVLLVSYTHIFQEATLDCYHKIKGWNYFWSWNDILLCYIKTLAKRTRKEKINFELHIRRYEIIKYCNSGLHKWLKWEQMSYWFITEKSYQ